MKYHPLQQQTLKMLSVFCGIFRVKRRIGSALLSRTKCVVTANIFNEKTWSFHTDPGNKQFKWIHDKVTCCGIYKAADVSFCQRQLFSETC